MQHPLFPAYNNCLWLGCCVRSRRTCSRDGGFVASLTAGHLGAAAWGDFQKQRKSCWIPCHLCLPCPAIFCCFGSPLAARRWGGCGCPQPRALVGQFADKGSQFSLPLRLLDDFQITSILEILLYYCFVEILIKVLLSGPGSNPGEMSILMSLLVLQKHSKGL